MGVVIVTQVKKWSRDDCGCRCECCVADLLAVAATDAEYFVF